VLAAASYARYRRHLSGGNRRLYVGTAVTALYLNTFVLIVQSFQNVPALKVLAPTQSEPPFLVAQLGALAIFIGLGIAASIRFSREAPLGWEQEIASRTTTTRLSQS